VMLILLLVCIQFLQRGQRKHAYRERDGPQHDDGRGSRDSYAEDGAEEFDVIDDAYDMESGSRSRESSGGAGSVEHKQGWRGRESWGSHRRRTAGRATRSSQGRISSLTWTEASGRSTVRSSVDGSSMHEM
jgi:hypothetical protein